jgi:hypothetical protein
MTEGIGFFFSKFVHTFYGNLSESATRSIFSLGAALLSKPDSIYFASRWWKGMVIKINYRSKPDLIQ